MTPRRRAVRIRMDAIRRERERRKLMFRCYLILDLDAMRVEWAS